MVDGRRGRGAVRSVSAGFFLLLGPGCFDDRLIDLPVEPLFGQPLSDERLPVGAGLPDAGSSLIFATGGEACSGAPVQLGATVRGATPPLSYEWMPATGLSDPTSPAPIATGDEAATYTVRVTDARGEVQQAQVEVLRHAPPSASISFASGAALTCAGGSVVLDGAGSRDEAGNPVASLWWDLGADGDVEGMGRTFAHTPTGNTSVRLVVTDSFGCTSSAEQELVFRENPTPSLAFTQGSGFVCAGGTVAVDASTSRDADGQPVAAYAWELDGDPATVEGQGADTGPYAPAGAPATVTVTDAQGCSATASLPIDVGALPVASIGFAAGSSPVCAGEAVTLDGAGSRTASGEPVTSFAWDLDGDPSAFESSEPQPSFTPAGDVEVRLVVTDDRGCSAEATRPIDSRPLPQASIAFARGAADACNGSVTSLDGGGSRDADGNPVAGYAWDLDGDGATDETAATTSTFPMTTGATARLKVTDGAGCVGVATQTLAPRALPTPAIAFLEGSSLICDGASLQLGGAGSRDADGNPVAAYEWDLQSDGVVDASTRDTDVFVPASGATVTLRVTDALGCAAAATTAYGLRANPTPRISFTQGAADSCSGATVELSGSPSTDADGNPVRSYAWDLDGDGRAERHAASSGAFVPAGDGSATLTVTDFEGCTASLVQPLAIHPLPVVDAGLDHSMCGGSTVQLGAAPVAGVSYSWSPATGLSDPAASNPTLSASTSATYTLTAADAFGCAASDTVEVAVHPLPVADAGADRMVARGGSIRLLGGASGGTPGYSYLWTPATSLGDPAAPQPDAAPTTDTVYTLQVTDALGCTDADDARIQVVEPLAVTAMDDSLFCRDARAPLVLGATVTGGVPPLSYRWTASPACPNCIDDPTAPSTGVTPDVDTVFTLTVTDANGTSVNDAVAVRVLSGVTVNAGPDRTIDRGEAVQIGEAAQQGLTYTWTCDSWSCGLSDPNASDPWVAPEGTTAYRVVASDGRTCTATDTVVVGLDIRVVGTVPVEGHDPWPRDALIWIIFDTDLDPTSFAGNVSMWDPYTGNQITIDRTSWDAGSRTLEIDPDERSYSRNNRPALVVLRGGPTGIRTSGATPLTMVGDFFLTFNVSSMGDGAEPRDRWLHPANGATNVRTDTDVIIAFDEPVDPGTVTSTTVRINAVPGTVTYDPRSWTATLRLSEQLSANTTYTVNVNGVQDGSGNRAIWSWTFTTGPTIDTTPPTVASSDPAHGDLSHDVAQPLSATFSELVDPTTLGGVRLLDDATGRPVSAEVSYDEQTSTAILDPNRMLEPGHTYRFVISGVRDQAGNALANPFSATFTTAPAIFLERFESLASGWTLGSPWAVGSQGARWGSAGLVDSPGGNYAASAAAIATSPELSLSGRSSVALSFWNRRAFANNTNRDKGVVEYSTNGSTWSTAGEVDDISGWRLESFTVPTGGASRLWFRLRTTSDASVQMDGWFVDELVVR